MPCVSSTSKEVEQNPSVSGTKSIRKRKYNEAFLQYGFTFITQNGEERPLCLICNEILASESLKPAKLKRHLELKNCSYVSNRDVEAEAGSGGSGLFLWKRKRKREKFHRFRFHIGGRMEREKKLVLLSFVEERMRGA